jgi:hypothetical protein
MFDDVRGFLYIDKYVCNMSFLKKLFGIKNNSAICRNLYHGYPPKTGWESHLSYPKCKRMYLVIKDDRIMVPGGLMLESMFGLSMHLTGFSDA